MSEVRLIDANALKESFNKWWGCDDIPTNVVEDTIDNAPTVDLKDIYQEGHYDGQLEGYTRAINEERPQGKWAFDEKGYFYCDKCGKYPHDQYATTDFCPKCGAEMKGGAE